MDDDIKLSRFFRSLKKLPLNINIVRPNVKNDSVNKESVSTVTTVNSSHNLNSSDNLTPEMPDNNLNEKADEKTEDDTTKNKGDTEKTSNEVVVGNKAMYLVSKKDYDLLQFLKSKNITKNYLSTILFAVGFFEKYVHRGSPDSNNNVAIDTINLTHDDAELEERINKLINASDKNKALIAKVYGTYNKAQANKENSNTPNIEKIIEVSNIINQVLVNSDAKIAESCASQTLNVNHQVMIENTDIFSPISEPSASDVASIDGDQEMQPQEVPEPTTGKNALQKFADAILTEHQQQQQLQHRQQQQIQQQHQEQHMQHILQKQQYRHYVPENPASVNQTQQGKQLPYRPDVQAASAFPAPQYGNNGMMNTLQMPTSVQRPPFVAPPWNPTYPVRPENGFSTGQCFYQQTPRAAPSPAPGLPALPVPALSPNNQRILEFRWQQSVQSTDCGTPQSTHKPTQKGKKRMKKTPTRAEAASYVRPQAPYEGPVERQPAPNQFPIERPLASFQTPAAPAAYQSLIQRPPPLYEAQIVRPPIHAYDGLDDRRHPPQLTPYQQLLMIDQQKRVKALEMAQQKIMQEEQQKKLQSLELQQRSWETPATSNYPNNHWAPAPAPTNNATITLINSV